MQKKKKRHDPFADDSDTSSAEESDLSDKAEKKGT